MIYNGGKPRTPREESSAEETRKSEVDSELGNFEMNFVFPSQPSLTAYSVLSFLHQHYDSFERMSPRCSTDIHVRPPFNASLFKQTRNSAVSELYGRLHGAKLHRMRQRNQDWTRWQGYGIRAP